MQAIQKIAKECVSCELCRKECAFLRENGSPGEISTNFLAGPAAEFTMVFHCNLCGLCQAVCPKKLDCSAAFLLMRETVQSTSGSRHNGDSVLQGHRTICRYEALGTSSLLSLHLLPDSCDTIFFPGCTLTATRSSVTRATYEHLRTITPTMGIVLDCCTKPSHDLGLNERFHTSFTTLINKLQDRGIKKIVTACPSCYITFKNHAPQFDTLTVYQVLAESPPPLHNHCALKISIHDTCTARFSPEIHDSIRILASYAGADIVEMPHSRSRAICCGEGAGAAGIAPEITAGWSSIREQEARGCRVVTYCAGCSTSLAGKVAGSHILDLLFAPEQTLHHKEKTAKPPFTYINRFLLKKQLQRSMNLARNRLPNPLS
ncbi:heterodisulfide reductase-related iron-sulfur binding cluster [Desulfopila inferna]|uniref:heterodisulfide reductase-related iron-sulfur binding cluster n=1 Tax=Desulfopila inferna TaxID=468528 RepID=UPI0019657A60|nr:(Fe-S)-binding protein [Desulfopila inferna]